MGATPTMNRSAKDGARSSPHYGGEGVTHSPIVPRCLLTARYGRFMRDPRRPVCVLVLNRVSNPISGKLDTRTASKVVTNNQIQKIGGSRKRAASWPSRLTGQ